MKQSAPKIQSKALSGNRIYDSKAVIGLQASSDRSKGALRGGGQEKVVSAPKENPDGLDYLFGDSKNTMNEAARMRALRERSFTAVESIFTNPLKPVLPFYGPPLESIIKTGPSMPGVSIGVMTPTEMHRLQREVQALRLQILYRTRQCPYADCDRVFEYRDAAGLDRHVREDHNVLRCFLCDKDAHLLPYYNTDQIKEHFVAEHVGDILETYGVGTVEEEEEEDTRDRELEEHRLQRRQQQQQKAQQRVQQMKDNANAGPSITAVADSLGISTSTTQPKRRFIKIRQGNADTGQPSSNPQRASVNQAAPRNNSKQDRPWIDSVYEEYEIRGGKIPTGDEGVGIRMDLFRAAKRYPGVEQQNPEAIKKFLDEYEAQLGRPGPLPKTPASQPPYMEISSGDDDEDDGEAGSEDYEYEDDDEGEEEQEGGTRGAGGRSSRRRRKRKRITNVLDPAYRKDQDNSENEDYEYSEKSAVADPLSPLLTSSTALLQPQPQPQPPPKKKKKQEQPQQQQQRQQQEQQQTKTQQQ